MHPNIRLKRSSIFILGYLLVFSVNAVAGIFSPDFAIVYAFIVYLFASFFSPRVRSWDFFLVYLPVLIHFALLAFLFITAKRPTNLGLQNTLPYVLVSIHFGIVFSRIIRWLILQKKQYFLAIICLIINVAALYSIVTLNSFQNQIYRSAGYIDDTNYQELKFNLQNHSGQSIDSSIEGKILVIQLFSVNCGTCRLQHKEVLEELNHQLALNNNVRVLAVNSFVQDDFEKFKKFSKSREPSSVSYFFDELQQLSRSLGIELFPVLLVLDQRKRCVLRMNGYNSYDKDFQITQVKKIVNAIEIN
jgi:thiol-disulfide isomerase/thioredoxin